MVSLLIVVPTLNSFSLLQRLCDSLCEQSWHGWSVLFVDGPSSSDHRNWLRRCCDSDARFSWIEQNSESPGIFGAMNQGFEFACISSFEWVMFWGSDDWAASKSTLNDLFAEVNTFICAGIEPDLVVCRGRYVNVGDSRPSRSAFFHPKGLVSESSFRHALWFGSTPPHQSTLFGIGARHRLATYDSGFCLSADLDYFLRLSLFPNVTVQCCDIEIVHMGDAGISGQQTLRRLLEVRSAYLRAFGWLWWFPFIFRYLRRIASLFFLTN